MDITKLVVSTYDKIADIYTNKYFSDKTDLPYVNKLLDLLPKNSKVLDVGSGPGNLSEYIFNRGFKVEGVDLSKKMLKISSAKMPHIKFILMDIRKLKYPESSFDGLIASYSIIHVHSKEIIKTLKGFWKVLRPKGVLLIIAQAGEADRIVDEKLSKGKKIFINFFTRKKLKDYLSNSGFEVVYQKEKQIKDPDAFSNRVIYTIARKN